MSGLFLLYYQQGWVSFEILITWKSYFTHLQFVRSRFSALNRSRHYLLQVIERTVWKNAFSCSVLEFRMKKIPY